MASASTKAATMKSILTPVATLKGHGQRIQSISYFPDGQRMISGSWDKTTRQWDLKTGKEIEEAQGVCEKDVWAVEVSRDGRWVVTGGGDRDRPELKACEVETGIVKEIGGHSKRITCIDISADGTLLVSGAWDWTVQIWNLETGKLVAGPFKSVDWVGAVRFSTNSELQKFAIKSEMGTCLEVWDVHTQKLDVRKGKHGGIGPTSAPMFWTNNNKNILTAFTLIMEDVDDYAKTIYEFDASTLETVGTPFEGHTDLVTGLALSSDSTLLASASYDHTIKLWAFEHRQLLATFNVRNPVTLVLSPDSCQLAYTTSTYNDNKIYVCSTPLDVLAQVGTSACKNITLDDVLKSNATRRLPVVHRKPPIYVTPMSQRPPTIDLDPQQPISLRLRRLLLFPSRTNAVPPNQKIRNNDNQLHGPTVVPCYVAPTPPSLGAHHNSGTFRY